MAKLLAKPESVMTAGGGSRRFTLARSHLTSQVWREPRSQTLDLSRKIVLLKALSTIRDLVAAFQVQSACRMG